MSEIYRTGNEPNNIYRNSVEYNQRTSEENSRVYFSGLESRRPLYGSWQGMDE